MELSTLHVLSHLNQFNLHNNKLWLVLILSLLYTRGKWSLQGLRKHSQLLGYSDGCRDGPLTQQSPNSGYTELDPEEEPFLLWSKGHLTGNPVRWAPISTAVWRKVSVGGENEIHTQKSRDKTGRKNYYGINILASESLPPLSKLV